MYKKLECDKYKVGLGTQNTPHEIYLNTVK